MFKKERQDGRRTALVAGGAGFVGSHLCDALLAEGTDIICVDSLLTGSFDNVRALENHPGFRFIEHDITSTLTIRDEIDEVYNLACAASPPRYQADPSHTLLTNVVGTSNLLALAEQHRAAFLQASTSEIYGDPEVHPQPETYRGSVNCTGPRACYDEGKRAAETLCFDHLRQERVDARVARIFNTYGPRMQQDDGRIVSNLIFQALQGRPLTVYGSGRQTRSFCYVSDMVAGLIALMRISPNPGAPVNLGNPEELPVIELARRVLDLVPGARDIDFLPLPEDDPQRRRPDIARAKALLDWEPLVTLSKGLASTIDWFATLPPENPDRGKIREKDAEGTYNGYEHQPSP